MKIICVYKFLWSKIRYGLNYLETRLRRWQPCEGNWKFFGTIFGGDKFDEYSNWMLESIEDYWKLYLMHWSLLEGWSKI